MPSLARSLLLLAIALSANALTTPHVLRNPRHHRGITPQLSAIDVQDPEVPENILLKRQVRNRRRNGRCISPPPPQSSSPPPAAAANINTPATPAPDVNDSKPTSSKVETTSAKAPASKPSSKPSPSGDNGDDDDESGSGGGGSNNGPSYLRGTQTGQGTFYGTGLGACGITNHDSDMIAAVSHLLFDTYPGYKGGNPNSNPLCNKKVTATYQGKSVTVAVTDRCEGCALTDLDFSPSAFNKLADPSVGRLDGVTWVWD